MRNTFKRNIRCTQTIHSLKLDHAYCCWKIKAIKAKLVFTSSSLGTFSYFPKASCSKMPMGQYRLQSFSSSISFALTRPGSFTQSASNLATARLKTKQKCIEMNSIPCLYMKKSLSSCTLRLKPYSDLVNLLKCPFSSGKELFNCETSGVIKIKSIDDEGNACNSETLHKSDEANAGTCDQVRPKGGLRGLPCNWHKSITRALYNSWYLCLLLEAVETFEALNFSTRS